MITTNLNVDSICQACPCFSPITDHCCTYDGTVHIIAISCEHYNFCKNIRKMAELEERKKYKEEKDDV